MDAIRVARTDEFDPRCLPLWPSSSSLLFNCGLRRNSRQVEGPAEINRHLGEFRKCSQSGLLIWKVFRDRACPTPGPNQVALRNGYVGSVYPSSSWITSPPV